MEPVIIIGAPRSGTNMLRDMLVELEGATTWPCDEINYIWRHGNVTYPDDQFTVDLATAKVKNYIQNKFRKFKNSSNSTVLVEKTCANSLRVDFINEIFPNAKYIFIERDPYDVIGSAKLRWIAKLDLPYLFKKVKYVPLSDLPFYSVRYLFHRINKLYTNEKRLGSWGPVLPDMQNLIIEHNVLQICAIQWHACVFKARKDLDKIPNERVFKVSYEAFVNNPIDNFKELSSFVGLKPTNEVLEFVGKSVSNSSIGKGSGAMTEIEINQIDTLLKRI